MQASAPSSAARRCSNIVHRRVGEAGVDDALLLVGEARGGLLRVVEDEAAGEEQRLGVLLELGRAWPARTPLVAISYSLVIKKPDPLG